MGRNPCCSKESLNRGAWTFAEDKILTDYINTHGEGRWRNLPQKAGLKRCGKSCRLRWLNYLRPDIKRGNISPDEEELIIRLHKLLGNRWSLIAGRLPGRTDNEIKNYWNTNLGKRVQQNTTNATGSNKQHHSRKFTKKSNDLSSSGGSPSLLPSDKMATAMPVVWTKAIKCTPTVIRKPQPQRTAHGRDSHADKEATLLEVPASNLKGNCDISNCKNPTLMGSDHDTSSCLNGTRSTTTADDIDQDHDQQNYLSAPDFAGNDHNLGDDGEELCLVDLLNSDYQFLDFLPGYDNNNTTYEDDNYVSASATTSKEVQSSSTTTDILFSEEMLVKDWSHLQPNVGSEFNSDFSSEILDGDEGDWLAD